MSLFDGSNCGIALNDKPVFSVQYHPEASPGPRDSHYLFKRFADLMRDKKRAGKSGNAGRHPEVLAAFGEPDGRSRSASFEARKSAHLRYV